MLFALLNTMKLNLSRRLLKHTRSRRRIAGQYLTKEDEDYSEDRQELIDRGFVFKKSKKIKTRKIRKYLIDGAGEVLKIALYCG